MDRVQRLISFFILSKNTEEELHKDCKELIMVNRENW